MVCGFGAICRKWNVVVEPIEKVKKILILPEGCVKVEYGAYEWQYLPYH